MNNLKMQSASATSQPVSKIPSTLSQNHQLSQNNQQHAYSRSTSRPKETSLQMNKLQAMLGKSTGMLS
jgi:hypothetical protein